jgi:16S rRNA (guanine527-N7)-methyltransferase
MNTTNIETRLVQGLENLQRLWEDTGHTSLMSLQADAKKFSHYIQLLHKWNQVYNLTAIRDPAEMVTKHILDSLSIVPYITQSRVIDVGTGAGLPGIPLAIIFPAKTFVLLDSNAKKTRFLQQCVQELQLNNVTIVQNRVESYTASPCFDHVVTRAFAHLQQIWLSTNHLCCKDGNILAMKGACSEQELNEVEVAGIEVIPLCIPDLAAARHLIIMSSQG